MRFVFPLLLLWSLTAGAADNLMPNGGFELPFVSGRTPSDKGGDPVNGGKDSDWISLNYRLSGKGGGITAGLTNEMAHNGKQSLYLHFDHVTQGFQGVLLTSGFIPLAPGQDYEIGIWGREDAKDPLTPDGRSAYVKLQVDYFAKDANESVGETAFAVQPMPGSKDHDPFFVPGHWTRFYAKLTAPPDAVFVQVTWRWETGSDPGEMNGTIFFDDSMIIGPAAPDPKMTPAPVQTEDAAPTDSGTAGETGAAPLPETTGTDSAAETPAASPKPMSAPSPSPSPHHRKKKS